MKTLFEIGAAMERSSEHTLLLEVGKDYCCQAFLHRKTNTIQGIQLLAFDEWEMENNFSKAIEPLSENGFESVVVCSSFPQALLVPARYFRDDYSVLNLVYDQPEQAYLHDSIPEWQMVNAYAVPRSVYDVLNQAFPHAAYFHSYTPAIKIYNGYVADNQLLIHFTDQHFRVLLKKDMSIHLAQTYAYKSPLDIIYYLLKICYEFQLSQQEVYLILSGLIEKDSALYAELQQYFTHIHFALQPEIGLPESPHPHYFFTSIYNLAACVS